MREGRRQTQAVVLALWDAAMVLLAMHTAWWLRFDVNLWLSEQYGWHPFAVGWTPAQPYILAIFVTLPVFWLILREMNLYSEPEDGTGEFFRLGAASFVASVLLAAIGFYIKQTHAEQQFQYSRAYSLLFFFSAVLCLTVGRHAYRFALRVFAQKGIGQNRILFVGSGPLAEELARALQARGTNVILGALSVPALREAPQPPTESGERFEPGSIYPLREVGTVDALTEVAARLQCDEVIAALPDVSPELVKRLLEDCYRAHVRFRMVPDVYEMLLDHMQLSLVGDIPLLGMRGSRIEGLNFICKRIFDIVVSTALLLVLAPLVFIPTMIITKLTDPGPIFYAQERIGFRRRRFKFWKFRSMRVGSDAGTNVEVHRNYLKKYIAGEAEGAKDGKGRTVYKLTEDPRVTRFGRFIRKFSIDELPQLWNVLIGDMSLIGPRPPISYEVENYRPVHLRRFEVLPGISGLWQVSGRNRLTFDEMVKLDLYYIENWSLELDIRILFKTISVVLFQRAH